MHGLLGKSYYKGGDKGNAGEPFGGNTVNNTGGTPGKSSEQKPIPGPTNPGWPIALKRAMQPKPVDGAGPGLPNKGTSAPGSVR